MADENDQLRAVIAAELTKLTPQPRSKDWITIAVGAVSLIAAAVAFGTFLIRSGASYSDMRSTNAQMQDRLDEFIAQVATARVQIDERMAGLTNDFSGRIGRLDEDFENLDDATASQEIRIIAMEKAIETMQASDRAQDVAIRDGVGEIRTIHAQLRQLGVDVEPRSAPQ